jgi:microcin C transport system substrate-binding protein
VSNFDCYVYEYFADNTAAFEALKIGQYLFHQEFFSSLWATAYNFPAIENGWVVKEAVPDERPAGTQGFWFNLRREKLQDPRVREAIGLMFNFEWTNATLFHGLYERTDSFWENADGLQAEGLPEGEELSTLEEFRDRLPPEIFTEPAYVPPVQSQSQLDRRALRRASRLLDQAGWTVGDDGMRRNAAGELLSIEYIDDNASFERVINPYIQNLRRIGIDARYVQVDAAQMQQRQEDFNYDMTGGRFVMPLTPSIELRQFERVVQSKDRETMQARVRALDRVLRAKHIWVPNWYSGEYLLAYWDVFGKPDVPPPPYARPDAFW